VERQVVNVPSFMVVRCSDNPGTDQNRGGIARFALIAHLAKVKTLNESEITPRERKESEIRAIHEIIEEIEESIRKSTFVKDFNLIGILSLHAKCTELVELLVTGNENNYPKVVKVLQDVLEIVTNDMMRNRSRTMDSVNAHQQTEGSYFDDVEPNLQLFASRHSVHFPLRDSDSLKEKFVDEKVQWMHINMAYPVWNDNKKASNWICYLDFGGMGCVQLVILDPFNLMVHARNKFGASTTGAEYRENLGIREEKCR
ncbi:hypothetical protein Tco_0232137, partial [Tanacetum coccineum]